MFAVALTAVALTASAPVPVTGGTGAERSIIRQCAEGWSIRASSRRLASTSGATSCSARPRAGRPGRASDDRRLWESAGVRGHARWRAGEAAPQARRLRDPGLPRRPGQAAARAAGRRRAARRRLRARRLGRSRRAQLAHPARRRRRCWTSSCGCVTISCFDERAQDGDREDLRAGAERGGAAALPRRSRRPTARRSPTAARSASGGSWSYGGDTASGAGAGGRPARAHAGADRSHRAADQEHGSSPHADVPHRLRRAARAALGSRCRRVLADRWALLPPILGDDPCAGVRPRRLERRRQRRPRGSPGQPRLLRVPRGADRAMDALPRRRSVTSRSRLSVRLRR